jgi:flavin reductase (DIM6/NTAB) family NADH-FMN oxidoreductase RutF
MSKIDFKGSVILNPVPVVMVTSRNKEGKDNVFTVAWTGTVCTKPPMLSISIRPERLSYEYIKETMEFTVNLPNVNLTTETDYCGVRSGRREDKIKNMKFTMKEGTHVDVPYIDECPISIECRVKEIIKLGSHDLFIAEVLGSHVDSSLMDDKGKIHFEWANLINYCHGEYFPMSENAIGKFGFSVAKNKPVVKTINPKKNISEKKPAEGKKKEKNYRKKSGQSKSRNSKKTIR